MEQSRLVQPVARFRDEVPDQVVSAGPPARCTTVLEYRFPSGETFFVQTICAPMRKAQHFHDDFSV